MCDGLELKPKKASSRYRSFILHNRNVVNLRVSNHNTTVSTWDKHNAKDGFSVVISGFKNKKINNDGIAHINEYFYRKKDIEKSKGKPLVDILESIQNLLQTGEYIDKTGLAKVEEVNQPKFSLADDASYNEAVNAGNLEKAQQKVDKLYSEYIKKNKKLGSKAEQDEDWQRC